MGLCASGEPEDYEMINPYYGDTFLCFRHGEGTYHYSNGDTYNGDGITYTDMAFTHMQMEKCE